MSNAAGEVENVIPNKLCHQISEYVGMKYVYILRSMSRPGQRYIGVTEDLKGRLADHNGGKSHHTAKFRPWRIETYIAFSDHEKALAFEKYLKSGAGWAFSLKRF